MKIKAPLNSQLLIYPMIDCTISAGFKNKKYRNAYGYVHYGVDFDSKRAVNFNVIASGDGTVTGVEKNQNSIGGVVVIKYPKVYNPTTKKKKDLIARYYHLFSINVKKGQTVKAYDVIGTVSGTHKWWNHVHMAIDSDIKFPFHTPQVSENASKLLIRKGATAVSILNPIDVLVVGRNQTAMIHNLATYVDRSKDKPRYEEI